jgi:hypothetical protein
MENQEATVAEENSFVFLPQRESHTTHRQIGGFGRGDSEYGGKWSFILGDLVERVAELAKAVRPSPTVQQ